MLARLLSKAIRDPTTGCLLWQGCTEKGYGRVKHNGKSRWAHIVSYELQVGPVPPGKVLDHTCRTRPCIEPTHLEPVTDVVNTMRGESPTAKHARKTHCPKGHPYDEENTYRRPGGGRDCRACKRRRRRQTKPVLHPGLVKTNLLRPRYLT